MTTSESSSAVKPPLPAPLFTDTALTDLNLHGNTHLTRTLLNQRFVGYDAFLERRSKIKSKAAGISALSDCDGCGLE
jgi:hypothetical protein